MFNFSLMMEVCLTSETLQRIKYGNRSFSFALTFLFLIKTLSLTQITRVFFVFIYPNVIEIPNSFHDHISLTLIEDETIYQNYSIIT